MATDTFHIYLYGPPQGTDAATLNRGTPFATSFEAAAERLLENLPTVLLEPDGSFAWASGEGEIVGMIYDAAMLIQYVELRGHGNLGKENWPAGDRTTGDNRPQFRQSPLRHLVQSLAGTPLVDDFSVLVLPERQWKDFQSFEKSLCWAAEPGNQEEAH